MNKKTKIIAVCGPTASGKSALAMALAEELGGEIISCDSMQVYRGMDIGTAKPSEEERRRVRHRMIDICEPDEPFSLAEYTERAKAEIEETARAGKIPIVCGGTGLYLDALLRGGSFESAGADEKVRRELFEYAAREGNEALHRRLAEIDPESAGKIHPNNLKRVVRAIEIYLLSGGMSKSEFDRRSLERGGEYDATTLCLTFSERDILYRRIDERCDKMIADGLAEETKTLIARGIFEKNLTAAGAIGYKELFGYIEGRTSLKEASDELKKATRNYAKRQITWFSAPRVREYLTNIEMCENGAVRSFEEIVNNARKLFLNFPFYDKMC